MAAMLFGQFALAAYVCPAQSPIVPAGSAHGAMHADAGQVPCAGMPSSAETPEANACEVHCNDGVTSPGQPDLPPVTLAALPVTTPALAQLVAADGVSRAPLAPLPGAPPPTLLFCRLLI
jgi:hypothetical protein